MASPRVIERVLAGGSRGPVVALAAHRAGSLSRSGAVAATVIGTAAVSAGWAWGALLIIYFVASSLLSRFRSREKAARTKGMVEKGGQRDATQVMANGGVFALCAVAGALSPAPFSFILATGALCALSAATADTWATEIGTLFGGTPRSVLTFQNVAAGTSGGVS